MSLLAAPSSGLCDFLSIHLTRRLGFLHTGSMLFSRGEPRNHTESLEAPEAPEALESLEAPEAPEDPEAPETPDVPDNPDNLDSPGTPVRGESNKL